MCDDEPLGVLFAFADETVPYPEPTANHTNRNIEIDGRR